MAFDWKSVLGQIAPTAATLLGGPFAGLAVKAVETALGTTPPDGTTPTLSSKLTKIQQVLTQGQMTGDQILALKQAELQLQTHLADNNIQLSQLEVSDVESARAREIAIKDSTPRNLAYLLTIGFFGVLTFLLVGNIPASGHDVLLILVGSLGTAWAGMVHYYYGSSPGSKLKDVTIHSLSS